MSGNHWIVLSVSAVYLVACLGIGLWPGRKSSDSAAGYVAGDRTLGLLVMYFITGATVFSSFAFLGAPGWAFSRGAAAFYIPAYGALGMIPFYFLGPRAARLGREFGFVTQAEMLAARFGSPAIAGVMAVISLVAFVPYLALQIKGAGLVLEVVTGGAISVEVGGAIVYGVVWIYVWRSGVLGVGWTNTFQGIFMMALAWGLGLYLPYKLYGGVGSMFELLESGRPELLTAPGLAADGTAWSWGEYSTAVIVSALGFSTWPHLFMKAFTARSERILRLTVVLYPTFQLFLVPLLLIGFAGVLFTSAPSAPDQILPHLLMNMEISPLLIGLFCAGALAASMSSGDAMVHAAASIAIRDGAIGALGAKMDPHRQRMWIRRMSGLVLLIAYLVATTYQGSLVALLLSAYGAVGQFLPPVVAGLMWRRASAAGLLTGLLVGSVVTAVLSVWPELRPYAIHAGVYGMVANVICIAVLSRLFPAEDRARSDRFMEVASTPGP